MLSRRDFLVTCAATPLCLTGFSAKAEVIHTVNGPIDTSALGMTLIHEHFLVDFIGADHTSMDRWNREEVVKKVLPYLMEVKAKGVKSILECTPAFLGRDAQLLKMLAEQSGLQILTNTGYYGAADNKYLPPWTQTESAEQLAARWVREYQNGINGTTIKPGFIKIGVNSGALSKLHRKLVTAAALTHLETGLTICSHTGPAQPAFEEIDVLKKLGVHPSAFVWVHAQSEPNKNSYTKAAQQGAWVSLDGVSATNLDQYAEWIKALKDSGHLNRVLISHDAGWYRPGEPNGGDFVGFTAIFDGLFPLLKSRGFTEKDFEQLLVRNPAEAFTIRVRKG